MPPTGVASSMAGQEERRLKLQDTLRTVGMLFKRLHRVYNICSDCGPSAGSQYTPIEPDVTLQSLVPMKDEAKTSEEKKPSEVTRSLQEERARLTEALAVQPPGIIPESTQVTPQERHNKTWVKNLIRVSVLLTLMGNGTRL
ncbi:hypothetical protein IscW_ISCW015385 [Ixodes scapularis]|uniref:Mediator of RNA polymerase II transcription subunit 30 n=1 Tax=Ixodes scapularis TaxID=6945 RepID=B7QMS6_IXOSC|nr:hypothetical protein IscW_ISCW015385 [Ixodes scapularis]|eukprot:XP_002400251.1 hypothetical protein IscW_ISCW015385 [Ixodes scapularis]